MLDNTVAQKAKVAFCEWAIILIFEMEVESMTCAGGTDNCTVIPVSRCVCREV